MAEQAHREPSMRGALTFIVAVAFAVLGMSKVTQLPFEVQGLGYYGFPVWFVFALGIYETLGGIAVLFRTTAFFAAVALSLEMIGAMVTFWLGGTPGLMILPLITLALTGMLAVARWREVQGALDDAKA